MLSRSVATQSQPFHAVKLGQSFFGQIVCVKNQEQVLIDMRARPITDGNSVWSVLVSKIDSKVLFPVIAEWSIAVFLKDQPLDYTHVNLRMNLIYLVAAGLHVHN